MNLLVRLTLLALATQAIAAPSGGGEEDDVKPGPNAPIGYGESTSESTTDQAPARKSVSGANNAVLDFSAASPVGPAGANAGANINFGGGARKSLSANGGTISFSGGANAGATINLGSGGANPGSNINIGGGARKSLSGGGTINFANGIPVGPEGANVGSNAGANTNGGRARKSLTANGGGTINLSGGTPVGPGDANAGANINIGGGARKSLSANGGGTINFANGVPVGPGGANAGANTNKNGGGLKRSQSSGASVSPKGQAKLSRSNSAGTINLSGGRSGANVGANPKSQSNSGGTINFTNGTPVGPGGANAGAGLGRSKSVGANGAPKSNGAKLSRSNSAGSVKSSDLKPLGPTGANAPAPKTDTRNKLARTKNVQAKKGGWVTGTGKAPKQGGGQGGPQKLKRTARVAGGRPPAPNNRPALKIGKNRQRGARQ
ncbi:hypothetical protein HDU96_000675 [Phlyctochytrium bullatum]|nr:hypothetical protein HDU96_000675 [Phlyctochytrium bullatum]